MILIGALISLMDLLTAAASSAVNKKAAGWFQGVRQVSSRENSAELSGLRPTSLHLLITISGDKLTAQYRVTASSGNALIAQALAAESAETGNGMVNNVLGKVSIAEFRDGITGNHLEPNILGFQPPQLQVARGTTTVTITSTPFRLMLNQQYIRVNRPAGPTEGSPESIQVVHSSGVQLLDITGGTLTSTAKGDTDLLRGSSAVTAVLREPGRNWTTGLRSIGGIILPVVGGPLQRLGNIFAYIVLLWSLTKASTDFANAGRDLRSDVAVSRNAVSTIVGATIALSILEFCYSLMFEIFPSDLLGRVVAGPVGLTVAGTVVLWPAACWRISPCWRVTSAKDTGESKHRRLKLSAALVTAPVIYLIILYVPLHLRSIRTALPVLLSTAGIVIVVFLLCNAVLLRSDRNGPAPALVLVSMLALVLASTVAWPVLDLPGFESRVNVIGKWIYLSAGIATVIGLCVMALRVIQILSASHIKYVRSQTVSAGRTAGAPWSAKTAHRVWLAARLVIIGVTLVAIVPALIAQSQVRNLHAYGLLPTDLTFYSATTASLYRALPQFLNWLLLALAVAVLLSISRTADEPAEARLFVNRLFAARHSRIAAPLLVARRIAARRIAARRIAIPLMMLILFSAYSYYYVPWISSNYAWLYLPVTPIVGLMILAWLVLPEKLSRAHPTPPPAWAIRMALQGWRNADFANSQRQQLMSNGDDLRKAVLKNKPPGAYRHTLFSLTIAQNRLADLHDRWQQKAIGHVTEAFDHQGELPDLRTAQWGGAIGTLLGLVPACLLFLTARPVSGWSGYPVLDFFGYTAWILFMWPALGWAIGYFLPFIRGRNGINKALWVYAAVAASLPMNLLWLDGHDWAATLIYYLELFAFLLIVSVILCDLLALKSAGMSAFAWIQVHHWRFVVTWSTAVLAAIGTAAVTFLSTAATDLSNQTTTVVTGQSTQQRTPP